ncbi:hypothetical protein PaG_04025 [Moesziomyces aphidis]|uniref:protein-ribulosamine 3-kinase n=1 Tax=Moesziomyces aphidis TaxID=84754 RepID=W3VK84_MOEAP|nr:hypothetical protein PaG_04025 [Moesziomyces aphidis]
MSSGAALDSILRRECSHIGKSFEHSGASRFIARPSGRSLFAKLDDHVEQTLGEAHSLIAMHKAQSGSSGEPAATLSPQVHAFGKTQDGNRAYLVTDYLDLKPSLGRDAQKALGRRLAEMHKHGRATGMLTRLILGTPSQRQDNTWEASWPTFWAERRIGDLVNRIHASHPDPQLRKLEEQMRDRVYPVLLAPLEGKIKPCILHGDLCSSYYGHNEADGPARLGIMHMFGGFTQDFFDAYHEVMPKTEPYYDQRVRLYELYHHLNHTLMFQGGYRSGAVAIMKSLIDFCDGKSSAE